MDLILKSGLPHQEKGVNSVCTVFEEEDFSDSNAYYANPSLNIDRPGLLERIKKVQNQNKVDQEFQKLNFVSDNLNLDIKMETGTGKTYVYTSTIYKLHKLFKVNKFIIVVPTLSIKAGTRQFIEDSYVKKHFKDICGYNTEIELQVLEPSKKVKGKQYFPAAIREFVLGSKQDRNKIQVLLVNMALLTNSRILSRNDYDYGVEGFYKPVDALRATKPFLLIDEPHRFSKEQKAFEFISKEIKPQCIIRYGATFPTKTIGIGKIKKNIKDYHNLIYNLNACDAFNQNLIKGISKEHFEPLSKKNDKVKISAIENKHAAKLVYIQKGAVNKTYDLGKGDSLSIISEQLEGITIEAIGNNFVVLSNGQLKFQGEEFSTDIYSSSYQEQMLKLAIERHFETEKVNFDRQTKIKTVALFFIDDIHSYRQRIDGQKTPYLKETFERLLLEKINEIIPTLSKINDKEYLEYLEASKEDVSKCHAGYFSQDNSDSDEDIAKQINEILFDKKGLLSFKTQSGKPNVRRFLFSKWTLKEGWDNPNIFTITKLRSSGSENSKLQEVGRGLRLPVDENGNRISNEEFKLNYITDFTEDDFAKKLINEINSDIPEAFDIKEEQLQLVAIKRNINVDELFFELFSKKFIDSNKHIILENSEIFFEAYPEFRRGLSLNKVVDRNINPAKKIKIRAGVYNELRAFWEAINHKYLLTYENIEDNDYLKKGIADLLNQNVFTDVIVSSKRQTLHTPADTSNMEMLDSDGVQYKIKKLLPYGEFLKSINKRTNLSIKLIHESIVEYSKSNAINDDKFNEFTVVNFVNKFTDWKNTNLQERITYKRSGISLRETALTTIDGNPKPEIAQGRIGTKFEEGTPSEKYLYDGYAFDSPLEKENILASGISNIIVYGKIPRNSIAIPTITGQSYTPDFMYVIEKENGEKTINVVIETKDADNDPTLRNIEKVKINCAKLFFNQLSIDGFKVEFHQQIKNKKMKQIIEEVLTNI
jgi:type III restriction enzyme